MSESQIIRHCWTAMPMTGKMIKRVNTIEKGQKMPNTNTYANRYGDEIHDSLDDFDKKHQHDDCSEYYDSDTISITDERIIME